MSRRAALVLGLVAVVAAAAVGWVAGSRIKSPAQVAAEAEPPEPSLITVPVERMVIANDVVTRGTVRFDQPEAVNLPPLAQPDLTPVVTRIPAPGDELPEGSVLFELAGRPTFALQGDLPLFRTVRPGDEGEDIAQLQEAMARLGYDPGDVDGVYGPKTQSAVRAFYAARGYEPVEPDPALRDQVDAAQEAVDGARAVYDEARRQRNLASAARKAVTAAEAAKADADEALVDAEKRLSSAIAGTHPDTGAPPTADEMAELEAEFAAAEAEVALAAGELEQARGEAAAMGPPRSISAEARALDRARGDLTEARRAVGDIVPEGEFAFFSVFPIRVDAVSVARGDVAVGEIMQVSGSRLAIDAAVSLDEAELIEEGDRVTIELSRLNIELDGTISEIRETPGGDGVAIDEVYVEVVPDEVRAELNNTNVKITIPVATRSSGGEVLAVPAAALSATASGDTIVTVEAADGTTRDVTVTPGLSAPGGMVEVTPVDGDLSEGDRVVVGLRTGQAPTTTEPGDE